MRVKKKLTKGFTLIELLVVISLIGLLSGIVVVNVGGGTVRARDAQRKSDLKQIQAALELYKQDQGNYPAYCGEQTRLSTYGQPWIPQLTPEYIATVPRDPKNLGDLSCFWDGDLQACGKTIYVYLYNSCDTDNQTYTLCAHLENDKDKSRNHTIGDNAWWGSWYCNYIVTNPD
jgi:type II secretion system protein G